MSTHTLTTRGALRKSDMRLANERLVLNIIRQTPHISRSDLVRITGFPASSITFIVNRMMRDGLLREAPMPVSTKPGRRRVGLTLRSEAMIAIGVEIARGEARVVSADVHGTILAKRVIPHQPDAKVLFVRIREAIAALISRYPERRLLGVGVSLQGTIDRLTGRVIADENQGWFDLQAGRILSHGSTAPFYFENDARLGALAERWFSAPGEKPLQNFVFVMSKGGLGTGVIVDGKPLYGCTGQASEFGHTTLFPDGRPCVCGNTGCWEEYASQRALERLYAERTSSAPGATTAARIVELARAGDAPATEVLRETAVYLGMGFSNLNSALNPEAIVVGDYLAEAWDLIEDWVWQSLRSRAAKRYLTKLRIIPSRHGTDSVLMGSLALVLSNYFAQSGGVTTHGDAENSVLLQAL